MSTIETVEALETRVDAVFDMVLARIAVMVSECPPPYAGPERRA